MRSVLLLSSDLRLLLSVFSEGNTGNAAAACVQVVQTIHDLVLRVNEPKNYIKIKLHLNVQGRRCTDDSYVSAFCCALLFVVVLIYF